MPPDDNGRKPNGGIAGIRRLSVRRRTSIDNTTVAAKPDLFPSSVIEVQNVIFLLSRPLTGNGTEDTAATTPDTHTHSVIPVALLISSPWFIPIHKHMNVCVCMNVCLLFICIVRCPNARRPFSPATCLPVYTECDDTLIAPTVSHILRPNFAFVKILVAETF